ncbi:hypothetical protein SCHPADRAFT_1002975 [Schizopora paradoxa]|uniref:Protein kinase domain-containing protein n=1 Tax=Schizopora paradoxa TaxID=27342 RepID=A0A0H2R0U6_9AGAM|nr:hypothetical protein SCHPADRAFT_1002975 [Schizopora paradoxa]
MLDFGDYRAVQIRLPQFGFPSRYSFDQAIVQKKYPEPISPGPQKKIYKIPDFEEIKFESTYGVCRAWTSQRDDPNAFSFIIKFAIGDSDERHEALRKEATVYHEQIPSVQGSDVPIFYGYFEGEKLNSNAKRVSCIFLEDCGDPVYGCLVDLPLPARAEIFKEVGRIHLCGMTLDDFCEGNVVHKGNSYRIIDFQLVEIRREHEHSCLWKDDRVYEGKPVPTFRDIGCRTMHNIGLELDLWKSRLSVEVMGSNCPKSEYPTQEAIDTLCQGVVLHQYGDEFKLQKWLKSYKQYEGRLTPEQYMEKFERPVFEKKYFGIRMDGDSDH